MTNPTAPEPAFPAGYRPVPLTSGDLEAVLDLDTWAFPSSVEVKDQLDLPLPLTWERTVGVVAEHEDPDAVPVDGAVPVTRELAAMHSSYPFARFPVPGATLPVGGLTWVGVHPGHRRRGLLRGMIDTHLAACRAAGEPLSALFAAEAPIYGRFGYGRAADDLRLTVPRKAALRDVPGAERHTVRIEKRTAGGTRASSPRCTPPPARATAGSTGPAGSRARRPSCRPRSGRTRPRSATAASPRASRSSSSTGSPAATPGSGARPRGSPPARAAR